MRTELLRRLAVDHLIEGDDRPLMNLGDNLSTMNRRAASERSSQEAASSSPVF